MHLRNILFRDRRSGDRIAATGCTSADEPSPNLGAEIIRIARTATSIHLAAARQVEGGETPDLDCAGREPRT